MFVYVLFYLGQLSHLPSGYGAGVTNLNEPPLSMLLSPRCCGLGAGSIPLRAIVNKKLLFIVMVSVRPSKLNTNRRS